MKKNLLLFLVAITLICGTDGFATIRRVGYFGRPINGVDYLSFALAYTAAANGDTILVFPPTIVIGASITKKLAIIGTGYFYDSTSFPKGNPDVQALKGSASVRYISFDNGSAGSVLMGFKDNGNGLVDGEVDVNTNDITIRRNLYLRVYLNTKASTDNLRVLENFVISFTSYDNNLSNTNLTISNNVISGILFANTIQYSGVITNNIWAYNGVVPYPLSGGNYGSGGGSIDLKNGSFLFQNNILCAYTDTVAATNSSFAFANTGNTVFKNNLAVESSPATTPPWSAADGNVITPIANATKIFVGFPFGSSYSPDFRYQLAPGSPALTVGAGGTPIGIYAGASPYKLSIIPSIPTVYRIGSPQGNNPTGSTIQINYSVRGNN